VALAAAFGIAPAHADPSGCTAGKPYCAIVPGVHDGVIGQPCRTPTQFAYGYDASGGVIECTGLSGQQSGTWRSLRAQLVGVHAIGDA
jgi:hypothetical protein